MDKHTNLLCPAVSDKENIYWLILHHIYIIFGKNRWPVKLGIQSGSRSVWIPNFMGNMFYQVLDNLDFLPGTNALAYYVPLSVTKENICSQILNHTYVILGKNRWPVKLGIQSGSWHVWIPNFMGNLF
jgi:hypothetical protein